MKIGHNKAFWLLFLNCFKIRNISFTLTCITGKHFTIVWVDIGCTHMIWGLISFEPIFFIWTALGWSLRRHRGLSLIYLYSSRGKENGIYAWFLQVQKHLQIENSGTTGQTYMKLTWHMHHLSTLHFQKKWRSEWKSTRGAHPKQHQKMPWNLINLLFNIM